MIVLLLPLVLWAGGLSGRAQFIGGTTELFAQRTDGRLLTASPALRFETRAKTVEIPYERIHLLEYGQKVDRRYVSAILVSPLFLLAKARKHFLTIGYTDREGQTQALVFRVQKADIRGVLVGLEARTGRKITYQDEDARKAGKG